MSRDVPSFGALPRKAWLALGAVELVFAVGLIVPSAFRWHPVLTAAAATVLAAEGLVFTQCTSSTARPRQSCAPRSASSWRSPPSAERPSSRSPDRDVAAVQGGDVKQFNGVSPTSGEDISALPVKAIGPAVAFCRDALRFTVVSQDGERAVVQRDDARLGLVREPDHDPSEAGSCAFTVADLDAMRADLDGRGLDLGAARTDEWGG